MTTMTIAKAINEGLRATLNNNPRSLLMGEDIGALGGVYRVTDGLIAEFGADRVVDTPLAESGIIGTAIGLSLRGYQPVCEIQFDGFVFPGFNQITTQLAKMHSRSNGNLTFLSSSGSPTAAASARSSTTPNHRRRCSPTRPACASSRRPIRTMPTG